LKFCFYIKLGDVRYVAILLSALGQGRSIWEMSIVTYKSALTPAMAIIFERTIFRLRLKVRRQFFEEQQQLSFESQFWNKGIGKSAYPGWLVIECQLANREIIKLEQPLNV